MIVVGLSRAMVETRCSWESLGILMCLNTIGLRSPTASSATRISVVRGELAVALSASTERDCSSNLPNTTGEFR